MPTVLCKLLLYYRTTLLPSSPPLFDTFDQANSRLENDLETIYALAAHKRRSTLYLFIIDMNQCFLR